MHNLPARRQPDQGRAALTEQLRSGDASTLRRAEEVMGQPASSTWIMARVAALLSHFPSKSLSEAEEDLAMIDWANALRTFPQFAIEEACRAYLAEGTWKPAPAHIVRLAKKACEPVRSEMAALRRRLDPEPERKEPNAEQKARVQAMTAELTGRLRGADR